MLIPNLRGPPILRHRLHIKRQIHVIRRRVRNLHAALDPVHVHVRRNLPRQRDRLHHLDHESPLHRLLRLSAILHRHHKLKFPRPLRRSVQHSVIFQPDPRRQRPLSTRQCSTGT
jgi:hypothetical protein